MDSANTPIDLSLYYPEINLTRQLEHYANLISGLFDHGFVLLVVRDESRCFYLSSDLNHPKWVSWFFAQPVEDGNSEFKQISFFLPGYQCCCQTTALTESKTRITVLLIRNTSIAYPQYQYCFD